MKRSWEALSDAIGRNCGTVAGHINISQSNLQKQTREPDYIGGTGRMNCLETVWQIMLVSEKVLNNSRSLAHSPLFWLAHNAGYSCVVLPASSVDHKPLRSLTIAIKEFGELADVSATVLAQRNPTRDEYNRVFKEGIDAINAIQTFMMQMEMKINE